MVRDTPFLRARRGRLAFRRGALFALAALASAGCSLPRSDVCKRADACDKALATPTKNFADDDVDFGDAGTCWQTAAEAAVCDETCEQFLDAQAALEGAPDACK